jgi:glycopeptide antibiotics resistance protein
MSLSSNLQKALCAAGLVAYSSVLLYGTLKPFQFALHPGRDRSAYRSVEWVPFSRFCPDYGIFCPQDTGVNIAMLIPVGALVALMPPAATRRMQHMTIAVAAGFLMSMAIETAQYFVPARFPSTTDLLLNTLGAFLGSLPVAVLIGKTAARRTPPA